MIYVRRIKNVKRMPALLNRNVKSNQRYADEPSLAMCTNLRHATIFMENSGNNWRMKIAVIENEISLFQILIVLSF